MPDETLRAPRRPWRPPFWFGVILMALSFAVYPVYPIVALLPISWWRKGELALGLSALSWGMFCVGFALVGRKGMTYLKQRIFSRKP